MDPSNPSGQVNSLSYLIPTGEHDIAVRELLIPILGDAISCKVPGAPCGAQGIGDAGAVAATLFGTFNAGTLVFVTILLIFIGLFAFVKTAQDGEFLGKSWNTTFTALRLMTGIAFILPMPNSYSTVQNLTQYVALWSSGLANEANVAVSEHYMKRLQMSMINQEPGATSIRSEAQEILLMHTCASLISKLHPGEAQLKFEEASLGSNDVVEYTYVERGSYLSPGSAPCGRLVVKPLNRAFPTDGTPTGGVWNAALGADPLTANARRKMTLAAHSLSDKARAAKIDAIRSLTSPNGYLRMLADRVVDLYVAGLIQYDPETGNISKVPNKSHAENFSAKEVSEVMKLYGAALKQVEGKLNSDLAKAREASFTETARDGETGFFTDAKKILQQGGWMGAAATYRTMLDMVSMAFAGDKQSPFRFEGRDEAMGNLVSSSGGIATQIASLRTLINRMMDSDTAKEVLTATLGDESQTVMTPPTMNEATLDKIGTSKLSTNELIETLYGTSTINGARNWIMKSMTVSGNADPLFQMKSIGDMTTALAEAFVASELIFRTAIATSKTALTWAKSNALGGVVNGITGAGDGAIEAITGAQYVAEQIFVMMKVLTAALVALGYAFSTWIPAIPYIAFLLAGLGWLFGLFMTMFAMNIWAVMHTTPSRNDTFIGSEAQGYLLWVALFFRPVIAVSALSLSYIIAPPVVKLVNITLLPMMFASNVSTNALSVVTMTLFGLVLYFTVIKGVLLMIYMIPQSFPDDVMRIISAGIGDLGQGKAMSTMETSEGSSRVGLQTLQGVDKASGESFKAKIKSDRNAAERASGAAAAATRDNAAKPSQISGSARTHEE